MFKQLIGQSLDRYRLISQLGEGELGAVFKAHDPNLQRDVAVKVLDLRPAGRGELAEQALQRARTAARLDHPGLVKVHDFGRSDGLFYVVMEYIAGGNLRQLLQDLRLSNQWLLLGEAVRLIRQLCLVADYVQRQGAPPRRIRPSDIMLKTEPTDGLPYRPVLTDLGLDDLRRAGWQPSEDQGVQRPAYAYWSPEQVLGEPVDARSQVYSLGVLLYELAVGWQPFPVKTISEAVRAHTRAEPPPPRARRSDLPAPLEGIILKALKKDPDDRYADPGALAQALQEVVPLAEEADSQRERDAGNWAVSLLVPYQRNLFEPAAAPADTREERLPDYTVNLSQGRIKVVPPTGEARYVPMRARGLTIGRDPANEITVDDPAVSAQHARVEFDGQNYKIVDLNSQNGTYVGGLRLLPGMPEIWRPDVPVLVGDTWLHLEPAQSPARRSFLRFDGVVVDANQIQTSPNGRVGIYVEVPQLTATPGEKTTAAFVVVNQGPDVDRFFITVEGVPANWITSPQPPSSVQLAPGGYQRLKLGVEPPRAPQSRAGRYNLTLRVSSQNAPDQLVESRIGLTVSAFTQFRSEISAVSVGVNQATRVLVHNQGNTPEAYTITFDDPEEALNFDPPAATLTVPEGQAGAMDFSAGVRQPRLIGGRRTHPFIVNVAAPAGQTQQHSAEVLSSALVPPWIPLLLLLFGCLLAGVAAFAWAQNRERIAVAATQAARETLQAVAVADSDQDGLSNAAEAQLGTDPLDPDTDDDGLLDGAEVTWGANPLVADTDGDTLLDGREVNELGTSPINPDTDGDGLNDNVDPDPGQLPTPTPTATDTPLPPTETDTPAPATETVTPLLPTETPTLAPATPTLTLPAPTPTIAPATPTLPPVPPGAAGFIIFETNRDANPEIYIMDADGSGEARLTNSTPNLAADTNPSWSAAREQIAFQSERDGNWEIYVMSASGAGQLRLTEDPAADTNPAWSPDGERIVFVSERDGNHEIYVMNADGTDVTRLTDNPGGDFWPRWSPDGQRIVFESERDGNREIVVMDADGSDQQRLTDNDATDARPVWSPNGAWIAFVSSRDGNNEIYLMNADGTGQLRLTNNPADDTGPQWDPAGGRIAFVSQRDGNAEIYVMLADGSTQQRLTDDPAVDAMPIWSPDGDWIAFASERDGDAEIMVVESTGGEAVALTDNSADDVPFIWRD